MKIITRNGQHEILNLNKITDRIRSACKYCHLDSVDPDLVAVKVCNSIRDNITTSELDEITAKICINMSMDNPDYAYLGSRIIVNNHQKNVKVTFSEAMEKLYYNNDNKNLVSDELIDFVRQNKTILDETVAKNCDNDFLIDYFGFKTLERSYLLKDSQGMIWETPQYLWMRVAIGIWKKDMDKIFNTYNLLSKQMFGSGCS